jgi:osmotically-inducible protein OsmY
VEEQEALDAAQFTAGVTAVVDQLEISDTAFADVATRTIRRQVREQLEWDVRVDASNISISVDDGIVTLSGTVTSAAAESAALASAWSVAGVRDVVDRLDVVADDQPGVDTGIARIVENSIQLDPDIEVEDLEVTQENGVVTLFGSVDEAWMSREAELIAENTIGVQAVENNLVVVPPEERTDVEVRLDVVSSLQADVRVDATDIEVIVDDGVVTLTGTVTSWDAWEQAYAIALQTEGVVDVQADDLTVES